VSAEALALARLRVAAAQCEHTPGRVSHPGLAAAAGTWLLAAAALSAGTAAPPRPVEVRYTVSTRPILALPPERQPEQPVSGPPSALSSAAALDLAAIPRAAPPPEISSAIEDTMLAPVFADTPSTAPGPSVYSISTEWPALSVPALPTLPAAAHDGLAATSNYWGAVRGAIAGCLRYPETSRQRGMEGRVMLRVCVDCSGALLGAEPVSSSDPAFAREAVRAARRAAPFPSMGAMAPTGGVATIPITFRLD
jgi:TonB family protein